MSNDFKEPKVLKDSEPIVLNEGRTIIQVKHLEYSFNDKKYPKLVISTFNRDSAGFPLSRPKSINLPAGCEDQLVKNILALKK